MCGLRPLRLRKAAALQISDPDSISPPRRHRLILARIASPHCQIIILETPSLHGPIPSASMLLQEGRYTDPDAPVQQCPGVPVWPGLSFSKSPGCRTDAGRAARNRGSRRGSELGEPATRAGPVPPAPTHAWAVRPWIDGRPPGRCAILGLSRCCSSSSPSWLTAFLNGKDP